MEKKKFLIIGIMIVFIVFIVGVVTNYSDSARVTANQEPRFCFKTISVDGSKVTYWGLGYKVIRYVGVSLNEPYEHNIGAKMGSWFMKYELPKVENIEIEYKGQKVIITNIKDIGIIENILINSKYNNEICAGINTYKINLNNEIYYIKESCKEIQKGNKQAKITDEDLGTVKNIIKNNGINEETNINWEEISDKGVNEEKILQNIDTDILQEIATQFQTLCDEIAEKQKEDPDSVLRGDWIKDVVDSPRYKKVIAMGNSAMKPLYFVIYKSNNQGMYEYICSLALEELSGYNFDEDGDGLKWATSKQFLKEFDKKILDN